MLSSCCEKYLFASVVLHKQGIRSNWKSDLLGSEPLTKCCYSNTRPQKDIIPRHPSCSKSRNIHLFSIPNLAGVKVLTYIGWCASYNQRKIKVTWFFSLTKSNELLLLTDFMSSLTQGDHATIWPQSWSSSWQSPTLS